MKKMNFFKILMSLTLALFVSGVFAQTLPVTNTNEIDGDLSDYVEIIQSQDGTYPAGANDFDVHVNLISQGSATMSLINLNGGAVGDLRYEASANDISFVTPFVVAPDQDLSPLSYAVPTMTIANIDANSTWTWTWIGPNPSANNGSTYQATGANAVTFNQNYVDWGDAITSYEINVVENTTAGGGCSSGETSAIDVDVVAFPQATENGGSATDVADCGATITAGAADYDLILSLVGTPPFHVGFLYEKITDQGAAGEATSYLYKTITTGATAPWSDLTDVANFDYLLANTGVRAYDLTIRINGVNFSQETGITVHTIEAKYLNGHVSRKSDRIAAVGSPDAAPANHVLYTATSGDFIMTAYPTPVTGNIFTIPN